MLEFVLAGECPDVVAMSRVLYLTLTWGADVVSFGGEKVSFGMPVASTLALWGTIERSRGTHLGAQEGRPWGPGLHF